MSRKKLLKKEFIDSFTPLTIGDRINFLVATEEDSGAKFCKKLGISNGNLNGLINDDSAPSSKFLIQILEIYDVNTNWILTGKGEIKNQKSAISTTQRQNREDAPETDDLIKMTRVILCSGTGYAESLNANIRSFYSAVETEQRLKDIEQRLVTVEKAALSDRRQQDRRIAERRRDPVNPWPEERRTGRERRKKDRRSSGLGK